MGKLVRHRHRAKRSDYSDVEIMDALEANMFNISQTARALGVSYTALRNWIKKHDGLNDFIREGQGQRVDELEQVFRDVMLQCSGEEDPRKLGIALQAAKILYDKLKSDKLETTNTNVNATVEMDEETEQKLKDLFGE